MLPIAPDANGPARSRFNLPRQVQGSFDLETKSKTRFSLRAQVQIYLDLAGTSSCARHRVADRRSGHACRERLELDHLEPPGRLTVAARKAERDVAVHVREHGLHRPGDPRARSARHPRATRLVERRVRHHANQRRVARLELLVGRRTIERRDELDGPRRPVSPRPRKHRAVLCQDVPERIRHHQRRHRRAEATALRRIAHAGWRRRASSKHLPRRRARSRAKPPALRHSLARRLARRISRVRSRTSTRIPLRQVVSDRRRHNRHQRRRSRIADPVLLQPAHRAIRRGQPIRASAGEHHRGYPVRSRHRAHHIRLPRPRSAAAHVHAAARPLRSDHDRAPRPPHLVRPVADPKSRGRLQHLAHRFFFFRRRRRRVWQSGQKYVERPPTTIRLIVPPQREHSSPSRVCTRNSSCIEPFSPRESR